MSHQEEQYLKLEDSTNSDFADYYILQRDHVYIKVGNMSVYISRADEGVVVDVLDYHMEFMTGTWALNNDAGDADHCPRCGGHWKTHDADGYCGEDN
jgi:hypothetical protein